MKKEANKKSKLWLWLVIGILALLAVAGTVLALVLGGGQKEAVKDRPEIYWNLNKEQYATEGNLSSSREKAEDGFFHIAFAYNGEQKELLTADKQLVNFIDTMSAMGLVFDGDGYIVDAVPVKEVATVIKEDVFVQKTEEGKIVANSSVVMNGMKTELLLCDKTGIFDVTQTGQPRGGKIAIDQLQTMDKISAYANEQGEITHVFVISHARSSKVYWRANQFVSGGKTTREPDENGYYTIPFYCEGERVEFKCNNVTEVNYIDKQSFYSSHFGLVFDDQGYIEEAILSYEAIHGMIRSERFDVTGIDGNQISTTKIIGSNAGTTDSFTIGENCPIYDVSHTAVAEDRAGKQVDSLQLGDRIVCFADTEGNPLFIYVAGRVVEDALWCYSLERKYDSTLQETTREPVDGWYIFEIFAAGQVRKVKTQNKALATEIDAIGARVFGLTLNGDEILDVYPVHSVFGYNHFGQGRYVTDVTGSIFTCIKTTAVDKPITGILGADCKIYNLSEVGTYGELTKLQVGDWIYAYQNPSLQIVEIFVMRRMVDAPIYYSLSRKYDSKNKVTTREPDADGWYVYDMLVNGKKTTVKTKSKALATKMDAFSPAFMTLIVGSDGVVHEAYAGQVSTGGYRRASGYKVVSINKDGTVDTVYESTGATRQLTLADYTKVYNVGPIFDGQRGELTSLRVGDIITSFNDIYDKAAVIFVRTRQGGSLCWNTQRMYDDDKAVSTREPDGDGWYVYELAVDGQIKTFKTQDKAVADSLDYYGGAFVVNSKDGIITGVASPSYAKDSCGTNLLNYDVMKIEGRKVTLQYHAEGAAKDGELQVIELTSNCKIYDVSPTAESFGAAVSLKVGDRVRAYKAETGELYSYVYIRFRDTRKDGVNSYCEVCKKDVYWTPWMGGSFSANGGHFYLNASMETESLPCSTGRSNLPQCTVCLDLNGNTYNRTTGRPLYVYENATLNIMDSAGGGAVIGGGIKDGKAGGVIGISGGTVNLYGGTLKLAEEHQPQERAGVVYLSVGSSDKKTPGTFNMYGGTITGGEVSDRGGNVAISGGVFNLYEGLIENGKAEKRGGNIVTLTNGVFNMYGGTVTGGTVNAGSGGNIYAGTGAMTISGGTVTGGTSRDGGGNIYALEALTISGGTVSGGTSLEKSGGNVYVLKYSENTSLTITGGTITGGKCEGYGGNIYTEVTASVSDATIEKGTSVKGGGNIYCSKGMTLNGATLKAGEAPNGGSIYGSGSWQIANSTITGGTATDEKGSGGNIYASSGKWTLKDSTVSGGVSGARGGNLYSAGAHITMESGTVTGGTSGSGNSNGGGNICTVSNGSFTLKGGSVTNGTSVNTGGNILSGSGALSVYGGTVSGGKAPKAGGDIYIYGGATDVILGGGKLGKVNADAVKTLELIGGPEIGEMILGSSVLAKVDGLTAKANIKLMAQGVFTQALEAPNAYISYFTAAADGYSVYVEDNALAMGAGVREAYCSHCEKNVFWKLWNGKAGNGHFYMDADLEQTQKFGIVIAEGSAMVLDLAGHKVYGDKVRAFDVRGDFCLMDSVGTGEVVTGGLEVESENYGGVIRARKGSFTLLSGTVRLAEEHSATIQRGGVIYIDAACHVTVKGGTVMNGVTTERGGNIFLASGGAKLTVEGGLITKGTAGSSNNGGGNIAVLSDSTVEIKGGTVSDGVSPKYGGNILATGNLIVSGGTITGGTAAVDGNNIYAFNGSGDVTVTGGRIESMNANKPRTVTLSGDPEISLMKLTGDPMTVGLLTEGAQIVVDAQGSFAVSEEDLTEAVEKGWLKLADDSKGLVFENGQLSVGEKLVGEKTAYCQHCDALTTWYLWNGTSTTGHFYLNEKVSLSETFAVPGDGELVVDLNGQMLENTTGSVFDLKGKLAIMDTAQGGQILGAGTGRGGVMRITSGTLDLYSGTLCYAAEAAGASHGGILYLETGAVANLMGGTITGGKSLERGGNLYVNSNSVVNISGTEITAGTSGTGNSNGGGNIFVLGGGLVNMTGGAVTNGTSANTAGNILVGSGTLKISGGTVSGGNASGKGQNIYLYFNQGTAEITGGTIESVTYNDAASFTVSGNPVIGELAVAAGKLVTLGDLTEGADITVDATGTFTTANENAQSYKDSGKIKLADTAKTLEVVDNCMVVSTLPVGAKLAYCEHCRSEVVWYAWNGAVETNHYYLDAQYELTETHGIAIPEGSTVVLDLAGFDMIGDKVRAFDISGEFVLMDTVGDGEIVTGGVEETNSLGGVIRARKGSFTLMSGTLRLADDHSATIQRGGVIYIDKACHVTVKGGTVMNGVTTERGGNIYVVGGNTAGGGLTVEGGTITGGTANSSNANGGGNIAVLTDSTVEIKGGVISNGNTTKTGGNILASGNLIISGGEIFGGNATGIAKNIYVFNNSGDVTVTGGAIESLTAKQPRSLTVSGDPVIGELELLNGQKVTLGALEETAEILVKAEGVFVEENPNAAAYVQNGQLLCGDRYEIIAENGQLSIAHASECYCDHCEQTVTWSAWDGSSVDGHYYLTGGVSYETELAVNAGDELVLDLNGYTVTATAGRAFLVKGKLAVLDYAGGGMITAKGLAGKDGGVLHINGGAFDLIEGAVALAAEHSAVRRGGVMLMDGAAVVNLKGGILENGVTTERGGNIYVGGGQLLLSGAIVRNGYSESSNANGGGNIFMLGNSVVTMTDGQVTGGRTSKTGGNICVGTATFLMEGGEISGGSATVKGPDVYVYYNASNAQIKGGYIEDLLYTDCASFQVSGNPVIKNFEIAAGKVFTLGDLTEGADITVTAEGVFTTANAGAAQFVEKEYIKASGENTVTENGGVLSVEAAALLKRLASFLNLV